MADSIFALQGHVLWADGEIICHGRNMILHSDSRYRLNMLKECICFTFLFDLEETNSSVNYLIHLINT